MNWGVKIVVFLVFSVMVGLYISTSAAYTLRILIALIIIQVFGNLLCYQLTMAIRDLLL